MSMTDSELFEALSKRIADPSLRIGAKTVPSPELFSPATQEEVEIAQRRLKISFPSLLVQIYREVGNGGFGPGFGLLGISGGYKGVDGFNLESTYELFVNGVWRRDVLPLFNWGDAIWTGVRTGAGGEAIVTSNAAVFTETDFTLGSWLEAWLSGVDLMEQLFESAEGTIKNPFTGKPVSYRRQGRAKGRPLPSS